jgi:oligopeptide/dipeptide ABC transporter ATP-binding protein
MYLGKIVETAPADQLYTNPVHPYTTALLSAVPIPDPRENAAREPLVLEGDVPSPIDPPPACRFHTRCPWATEICSVAEPPLADYGRGRIAACHHPLNVTNEEVEAAAIAPQSPQTASEELPTPEQATA